MLDPRGCRGVENALAQHRISQLALVDDGVGRLREVHDGACPLEERLQVGLRHIDAPGFDAGRCGRHLAAVERHDPGNGGVRCSERADLLTQLSSRPRDNNGGHVVTTASDGAPAEERKRRPAWPGNANSTVLTLPTCGDANSCP